MFRSMSWSLLLPPSVVFLLVLLVLLFRNIVLAYSSPSPGCPSSFFFLFLRLILSLVRQVMRWNMTEAVRISTLCVFGASLMTFRSTYQVFAGFSTHPNFPIQARHPLSTSRLLVDHRSSFFPLRLLSDCVLLVPWR